MSASKQSMLGQLDKDAEAYEKYVQEQYKERHGHYAKDVDDADLDAQFYDACDKDD